MQTHIYTESGDTDKNQSSPVSGWQTAEETIHTDESSPELWCLMRRKWVSHGSDEKEQAYCGIFEGDFVVCKTCSGMF